MKKPILPLFVLLFIAGRVLSEESSNYQIVRHDNLWNLAKEYLGQGEQWRDIWKRNRYIDNPNLIYPGNRLVIPGIPTKTAALKENMNKEPQLYNREKNFNQLVDGLFTDTMPQKPQAKEYTNQRIGVTASDYSALFTEPALRATPFIWKKMNSEGVALPGVGHIDDKSRQIYNKNRTVKVVPDRGTTFAMGDTLDIFRSVKTINKGTASSQLVEPVGTGVIVNAKATDATLKIIELWGVVKHDDRLVPANENIHTSQRVISLQKNPNALETGLLTKVKDHVTIHPFEMLILDKGTSNGVKAGNLFHVYEMIEEKDSKKVAPFPSMEGVVVLTNDNSATIKITNITKEVRTTDLVFRRYGSLTLQ